MSSLEKKRLYLRAPAGKVVGPAAQLKDGLAGCAEQRGLCRHEACHSDKEVPSRCPLNIVHRAFLRPCITAEACSPAYVCQVHTAYPCGLSHQPMSSTGRGGCKLEAVGMVHRLKSI